jgi:multisubunit Na+/H+ antiporter MnhF subunit
MNRKRLAPILLIIGMVFLLIGMTTDQVIFTYIAIALAVIAFVLNARFFQRRK